jgi:predicted DsbA family dithiol-disulfide isomerase
VALVLKHMPLRSHKKAEGAAIATQAAHRQGKAWEMHKKLFENRRALDRGHLEQYAEELGLDVAKFKADLDDPKVKEEVLTDQKAALAAGARSTPTCYINGRPVRGAKPFSTFSEIVETEIATANELIKSGTPLAEVYEKSSKAK